MSVLTQVEIGGVDVTSYVVDYETDRAYGDAIAKVEIQVLKTIANVVTVDNGDTIEIWRGLSTATDKKIFSGYVETYEPDGGLMKIKGNDKLWDLVRKEVTEVYDSEVSASAGKISDIFIDLIETYGGLSTTGATVQDSGTLFILEKFICNHADIMERCKALATALDWQFYYRADTDKVYFEPKGYTSNANIITVGTEIFQIPKWEYDISQMANDLTIVGAYQEVETTESGKIETTADYLNESILIDFTPLSVKVFMDAANPPTTLLVGGLPDSTATFDYYVDKETKKIMPKSGTTFTTDDFAEIRYSHAVPIPVHMFNQASIDSYGASEKTITYEDIRSVDDAENRGTEYLARYKNPFIYSTLKVKNTTDLAMEIGQLINVVDGVNVPNVDKTLVINRLRERYPSDYDEIEVGDKKWRLAEWQANMEEKVKRLQESELANQDIVNELLSVDNTSSPIEIRNRYLKTLTKTYDSSSKYIALSDSNSVDHKSLLDTYKVLGSTGDNFLPETDHSIQQYENSYDEEFIDADFKDVSSTATWTTGGSATFTNGQIAQSSSVDYNNGTITSVTLTSDSSTNLTFEVTADGGSNWESTTSGEIHIFSDTGTDLRWRATASGNAQLNLLTLENYH